MSVNRVHLVGNIGRDPELRHTKSETAVCSFSLATSEKWTGKDGNKETKTEWHRIVAWGKLGEICGEYLSKGKQVYIEGRLQTREWEDEDGNKRQTTEIVANNMTMLGQGPGGESAAQGGSGGPGDDFEDDDMPH